MAGYSDLLQGRIIRPRDKFHKKKRDILFFSSFPPFPFFSSGRSRFSYLGRAIFHMEQAGALRSLKPRRTLDILQSSDNFAKTDIVSLGKLDN